MDIYFIKGHNNNDIQMRTKLFPILIIYDICNFTFLQFYTGYRYYIV